MLPLAARLAAVGLVATLAGCAPRVPTAPALDSGAAVVAAMHARWHGVRAPTLTFVQQTVVYRPEAAPDTTTWYEAAAPGRLRIDIEPLADRTAIFYVDGVRTVVRGGEVVSVTPDVNVLLLALMDVYHQPPAVTHRTLDSLGFATSTVHERHWKGRPVVVVGAAASDTTVSQLWVDRERLVPLRVVQKLPEGGPLLDAHVGDYRQIGGVWHEHLIEIFLDGRRYQDEWYRDVHPGVPVEAALFDPSAVPPPRRYWE